MSFTPPACRAVSAALGSKNAAPVHALDQRLVDGHPPPVVERIDGACQRRQRLPESSLANGCEKVSVVGVAEEHLPHIFQPFDRVVSHVEGSGLGLSITKEIDELHGGEITVSSKIGVGTTFRFWLPALE